MSEIHSPSYIAWRAAVQDWLRNTPEGRYNLPWLKEHSPGGNLSDVFEQDDHWLDWEEVYRENKGNLMLANSCAEARKSFEIGPALKREGSWRKIASFPIGYVLRRQSETQDPEYWNDPRNFLRECLDNPDYCTVPRRTILGELEQYEPRTQQTIIVTP